MMQRSEDHEELCPNGYMYNTTATSKAQGTFQRRGQRDWKSRGTRNLL